VTPVVNPTSTPERPPRASWPLWAPFAALGLALVVTVIAEGLWYALLKVANSRVTIHSAGVNIGATAIQDAALIGCAVWIASRTARPRASQFGLRATPVGRALKWAFFGALIYLFIQILYVAIFNPHEDQTTLKDLGAGSGGLATVAIGILVVGLAPVAEETFFRGFVYGTLRTRFTWVPAALIAGAVFGVVHGTTGWSAVPPLIGLGFALCMVYEATGSILPTICMHALNNMVAFGADKQGSWVVAVPTAVAVITACLATPGALRARTVPT
jgi:membrane protease YdiL (CAAX protease family)